MDAVVFSFPFWRLWCGAALPLLFLPYAHALSKQDILHYPDPSELASAPVTRVIDGDTIEVSVGGVPEKVRYAGVDARETGTPCAQEAADRNAALAGAEVLLFKAPAGADRDVFGRLLRHVYKPSGESLEGALVREGLVHAWRDGSEHSRVFQGLEKEAWMDRTGCLWENRNGTVVINEVQFDSPSGAPDWVELYNAAPFAISIDGWTLDDEEVPGSKVVVRLSSPVPAGAFVLVYVNGTGIDDTDFSDNLAVLYSGSAAALSLAATEDEVSLYSSTVQSSATLVDFLAWVTDGNYGGAGDQTNAILAGIWSSGTAVSLMDTGSGYSVGRWADGIDSDSSQDWVAFSTPTPGAAAPALPPPEECGNDLDDDGDGKTDCADGDCAAHAACAVSVAPRDVVINEIAWSGTAANASHEWMELFNNTSFLIPLTGWTLKTADGDVSVPLEGVIPANGFFLLERATEAAVSDAPSDQVYAGSLSNSGEDLVLLDADGRTMDEAPFSGGWPAGTPSPHFRSMERVDPSADGGVSGHWRSNDGVTRNGADAGGQPLNATPRSRNSVLRTTALSVVPTVKAVEVDPSRNPFSPHDPEAAYRTGRIWFNVGAASVVKTLRVLDLRGAVIKTLINNDAGSDGTSFAGVASGAVAWDGRNDQAEAVPMGIYVVFLEGVDGGGGGRVTGKDTIALGRPLE